MKLSIFFDHVTEAAAKSDRSVEDILAAAYKSGIEAVDINNSNVVRDPEVISVIKKANMKVACSFEFYNWGGEEYNNFDRFKAHLANAKAAGQSTILVIPGFLNDNDAKRMNALLDKIGMPESAVIDPSFDEFMRSNESVTKMTYMLREAVKLARAEAITVTLEDFDGYNAPFARTLGLLWFMQNVEGLKFTFDTGNFIYSDELMEEAYPLLCDYIVHVHTKDRSAEEKCTGFKHNKGMAPSATGEGYLPIEDFVRDLLDRGYNGYFAIEHYGHQNQAAAIVCSAEKLLSYSS